jgi:hypothetical protein
MRGRRIKKSLQRKKRGTEGNKGIESQSSFSRRLPRCHKGFGGLIKAAVSTSAVSLKPLNPLPRSQ